MEKQPDIMDLASVSAFIKELVGPGSAQSGKLKTLSWY